MKNIELQKLVLSCKKLRLSEHQPKKHNKKIEPYQNPKSNLKQDKTLDEPTKSQNFGMKGPVFVVNTTKTGPFIPNLEANATPTRKTQFNNRTTPKLK